MMMMMTAAANTNNDTNNLTNNINEYVHSKCTTPGGTLDEAALDACVGGGGDWARALRQAFEGGIADESIRRLAARCYVPSPEDGEAAMRCGRLALFLELGGRVRAPGRLLHEAARLPDSAAAEATLRALLSRLRSLDERAYAANARDYAGRAPLHVARTPGAVRALVAGGARPGDYDAEGRTPREHACTPEVERALVEAAAAVLTL